MGDVVPASTYGPTPTAGSSSTSPDLPRLSVPSLQEANIYPLSGRCPCSSTVYSLTSAPLIVHACHCTYCQRESGTAFALNAIYEPSRVVLTGRTTSSQLIRKAIPTASATDGQTMVRCPECYTVVWSHYRAGGALVMVRVGTIDAVTDGERVRPNGGLVPHAHIFAREGRHDWLTLEGQVVYEGYGPRSEYWPKESLERLDAFSKEGSVEAFKE